MKKDGLSGLASGLVVACVVMTATALTGCCDADTRNELIHQTILQEDTASAAVHLVALKHLREGRVDDAINLLEIALAGEILSLGTTETSDASVQAMSQRMLQNIKTYREQYPQGSSMTAPEVKKHVEEILSGVK